MDNVLNLYKKLQELIQTVIGFALIAMMVVIFAQTFTRYVIFYSLPWSEELSRYLFVLMILLGINVGISQNLMVRIDLIDSLFKGKAKVALDFFRDLVCLAVSGFFLWSTFGMVQIGRFQKSPALQLPMHYLYLILTVGFALAMLSFLLGMVEKYILQPGKEEA